MLSYVMVCSNMVQYCGIGIVYMFRILFSYWLMFLSQKHVLNRNSNMNKTHLSIPKGCLLAGYVQRILFICIDLTITNPLSWYCPVFSLTESVWQLTNAIRANMLTKTLIHQAYPIIGNFKKHFLNLLNSFP